MERHVDVPAMVLGRALDVLIANPIARALHPSYLAGLNLALDVFLHEEASSGYADLEPVRRSRIGSLRMAAGALPDDPRLIDLVGELSIRSPAFGPSPRPAWDAGCRHESGGAPALEFPPVQ